MLVKPINLHLLQVHGNTIAFPPIHILIHLEVLVGASQMDYEVKSKRFSHIKSPEASFILE